MPKPAADLAAKLKAFKDDAIPNSKFVGVAYWDTSNASDPALASLGGIRKIIAGRAYEDEEAMIGLSNVMKSATKVDPDMPLFQSVPKNLILDMAIYGADTVNDAELAKLAGG